MITVLIFLRNFRLNDNKTLQRAAAYGDPILPVLVQHTSREQRHWYGWPATGPFRQAFTHECIADIERQLFELGLHPWRGQGDLLSLVQTVHQLFSGIRVICPHVLGEYEGAERAELIQYCQKHQIECDVVWDWTLIDPPALNSLPLSFTAFRKKVERGLRISSPLPAPDSLQGIAHELPSMSYSIDFDAIEGRAFHGGESIALSHLNDYIWATKSVRHYKQTRNKLMGKHVSSKVSAYLSSGCLSPRQVAHQVKQFESKYGKNDSTYWLIFELLWRDFFQFQYLAHAKHWFSFGGIQQKQTQAPDYDAVRCDAWVNGKTPNNFINAAMNELRQTGHMSNRGRQNAASYLIHDLGQDWRFGAAVFEHYLIDYDVASNIGNWMYIAGVGNSRQVRAFNVVSQQERYDKNLEYTNYWTQPRLF
ncbi:MAG: DASH family cryptochrome [Candidatus Margulisiibacteriota bacterium]